MLKKILLNRKELVIMESEFYFVIIHLNPLYDHHYIPALPKQNRLSKFSYRFLESMRQA